jgi:hypothetical protein
MLGWIDIQRTHRLFRWKLILGDYIRDWTNPRYAIEKYGEIMGRRPNDRENLSSGDKDFNSELNIARAIAQRNINL